MSRTIHPHALRTLALVGLLGVAPLVTPAATHAQSITLEQALVNRTAVGPSGAVTADPVSSPAVDGEWRSVSTILSDRLSLLTSVRESDCCFMSGAAWPGAGGWGD